MTKLTFILVALFSFSLQAVVINTELRVATITSNTDREITEFFVEVAADGSLDGLHIVSKKPNGDVTQDRRATVEEVISTGMVLRREGNRDVITLEVQNFTPELGGKVIVDYLYSGVSGARRKLHLGIKKTTGDFFLHTPSGSLASQLKIYGNWSPILGLIGIAEIRVMNRSWWR